jgi:pimeloyl-ACP methyl ester carboxylesterase
MGTIDYQDTGGAGPVIVLLHGVAMNASVWRHVVPLLADRHRVVAPTLPLGAHRQPMRHDADLTLHGHARLVAEFLERADLSDVTLVQNDVGIGLVLAGEGPERVARLVLASTEAFDNYPPGLPGRMLFLAARAPGGLNALIQPLRFRPLRRLPMAFGWMAKRPIPHEITDGWLHPMLTQPAIRRDIEKYIRSTDRSAMIAASERLRSFQRPALVVWAAEDHVMPVEHGHRLADLLPQGTFVEIGNSYTLIPEDQPDALAKLVSDFVADTSSIDAKMTVPGLAI